MQDLVCLAGGVIGVDVFFVISGYLITSIITEETENKQFNFLHFYEIRARRIMPALFLVMIVCIPFAWYWMLPNQMNNFSKSLIAVNLFSSNIFFWRESGYFAAISEEIPLLHTWSLAVEEQYYALFPIFIFLTWRFGKKNVFFMLVVFLLLSLGLSQWASSNATTANFYLAPTRVWELLAGSIAALIVQYQGVRKNHTLSFFGLVTIIFSIFSYDETTPFPSLYTLAPVVGTMLVILYSDNETFTLKLLSNKILVGIGLISYSAYLWHQPLFAFARIRLLSEPTTMTMVVLCGASLLMALFSFKYIERPFKNNKTLAKVNMLKTSTLGIVLFVSLGVVFIYNDNFNTYRFIGKPSLNSIYSVHDREIAIDVRSYNNRSCNILGLINLEEEVCVTNTKKPRLLIVGDSKAMALASAIFAGYYNIPTLLIAAHSCPTYPKLTYIPDYSKKLG